MPTGLLGRKVGMTQVFDAAGAVVPVTVIEAGPCVVLQVKTVERDRYSAVQLGFADKPRRVATQPERGHARKTGSEPKRFIREMALLTDESLVPGQQVTVQVLEGVKFVDVVGTSKGRGFAGVVKRHHFHGQAASHGVERKHRSGGSVGQKTCPGRVMRGKRMAGHMGAARSTARNLEVVRIDPAHHLLLVKGSVPGPDGGYVMVQRSTYQRGKS
jgi:large subunit ribosomal protein L3